MGIDLQESATLVKTWGLSYNLTYPLLLDGNASVYIQYGDNYIPYNVVIDPQMVVRYTNSGYYEEIIKNVIEAWLPTTMKEKVNANGLPLTFRLYQNYPNPFNAKTTIEYYLAKPSYISIKIFNLMGKEIATLVNEQKNAGNFSICWDGKDNSGKAIASGIYIYRIKANGFTEAKKLSLLK